MYEIYVIYYNDSGEYLDTADICLLDSIEMARWLQQVIEYYYHNETERKIIVGFSRIHKISSK